VSAVNELSHFPSIDEKCFASTVTEPSVFLGSRNKPEAHWNLGRIEKLTGQGDHAIQKVGFNDRFPNVALSRLVGRH
jgi:hypothetical protein